MESSLLIQEHTNRFLTGRFIGSNNHDGMFTWKSTCTLCCTTGNIFRLCLQAFWGKLHAYVVTKSFESSLTLESFGLHYIKLWPRDWIGKDYGAAPIVSGKWISQTSQVWFFYFLSQCHVLIPHMKSLSKYYKSLLRERRPSKDLWPSKFWGLEGE